MLSLSLQIYYIGTRLSITKCSTAFISCMTFMSLMAHSYDTTKVSNVVFAYSKLKFELWRFSRGITLIDQVDKFSQITICRLVLLSKQLSALFTGCVVFSKNNLNENCNWSTFTFHNFLLYSAFYKLRLLWENNAQRMQASATEASMAWLNLF